MKKTLFSTIALTILSTSCAVAGPLPTTKRVPQPNGTTVEVRQIVNHPSQRSGSILSKLIITRDANGRIISVKRS